MSDRQDDLKESPSQTAGPYVHIGAMPNYCGIAGVFPEDLGASPIGAEAKGARIRLTGRVFDGYDAPVKDALIEIWHADAAGLYPGQPGADPHVSGFARRAADRDTGEWSLETVKPGPVPFRDGRKMAPHLGVWVFARGINIALQTRIYFPEDRAAFAEDPVLGRIEQKPRVETLVAEAAGEGAYRFDMRLQGPQETVFFDL